MESTDINFEAMLNDELQKRGCSCKILCLNKTDSTNLVAKKLLQDGQTVKNLAVVSREQTKGRGSHERSFFSYTGGLYLSFVPKGCFSASDILRLTPYTAVATVEAIQEVFGIATGIKWVNDIIYRNKKLSGILVEGVDVGNGCFRAVIGIGINLFKPPQGFNEELSGAIWLSDVADEAKKAALCAVLVSKLNNSDKEIMSPEVLVKYASFSAIIGKKITFEQNSVMMNATAVGIAADAGLVVRFSDGKEDILRYGSIFVDWEK